MLKRSDVGPGRSLSFLFRLPTLNAKTRYAIDTVKAGSTTYAVGGLQPRIVVQAGMPMTVSGWAVDDKAQSAAKSVSVAVDGGQPLVAEYNISRPDVAKALGNGAFARSGFLARINTAGLKSGPHELTFAVVDRAGDGTYQLPVRLQFTVL